MKQKTCENELFVNVNYAGQRLCETDYDTCTFQNCDFSDGVFTETDFINCRFEGCNLAMTKMGGTGLKEVEFIDCKLMGINFHDCSDFLFAVNFQKCLLDYSSFQKKRMKKANFADCSMKEVDFTGADLSLAIFGNCDLSKAIFWDCNLEKADFRTAYEYSIDPEANRVKKAKFSMAGIAGLLEKYKIEIE